MKYSPPYPGPDRALGLSVRRLTFALGDLRQAAVEGDLRNLLTSTNALEEAASELAALASRIDRERAAASPDGSTQAHAPEQPRLFADVMELKQEHQRTRALLLQALEITKSQYNRLCRRTRPDRAYLPATAIPAIIRRALAE